MRPLFLGIVALTIPAVSLAEPTLRAPREAALFDYIATPNANSLRPLSVRRLLPARGTAAGIVADSRTIYLNREGVTLRPGVDDSRSQHSSIIDRQVSVPRWNTSDQVWNATVECFRDLWKDFDVVVTDQDPGNVPHMEAVFGGAPQDIGMPSGVGGVSPYTEDCAIIENSIVFTFTEVFPDDPQTVCEVMAQEVAHSFGLDHELLASDPMTYLNYNGNRTFKDQDVSCGEFQRRDCGIGNTVCWAKQNSVKLLKERAGIADAIAPTLVITSPADAALVAAGFVVAATASDDHAVTKATLYIDDQPAGTLDGAGPYSFPTDATLANGSHTVRVEVTDGRNSQSQVIHVTIDPDGGNGNGNGNGSGNGNGDGNGDGAGSGCAAGGDPAFGVLMLMALARFTRRARAMTH